MRLFIFTTVAMLFISFQICSGQTNNIGDKERSELKEYIKTKVKENNNKFDTNWSELRNRGYLFHTGSEATNSGLKTILAMDDKLVAMQSEINYRIHNLKNSDLINDMKNTVANARYDGSTDSDYEFTGMYNYLGNKLSRLREKYSKYDRPGSSETNAWYFEQILMFNEPNDERTIKLLEDKLLYRKQLYEQRDKIIAERERKQAEYEKQEKEVKQARREEERIKKEKEEENERKRNEEIASLPSKAEIKAKFRTYKHKTGYIFEMFPIGFTPKLNKSTYDKVQILGKVYTARYREHDEYGGNSLIIEFYDSGKISTVSVYNGSQLIYVANYNDGANKPYEISTKTPDDKYHLRISRDYNPMNNKVIEKITYYYEPLSYYFY